jgi:2'-5' RNA ligase
MARIFIAVKMPDDVIQKITRISNYFQKQTPKEALKWVETENLHLTLKFLGEIPESTITKVQAILKAVADDQPPFDIAIAGLGMYPHAKRPRVVWLGVEGVDPLIALHKQLDSELAKIGLREETRPFNPHLTLGRVRQRTSRETAAKVGDILSEFKVDSLGSFTVGDIHLIESQLTPQGPIYTTRFTTPLSAV